MITIRATNDDPNGRILTFRLEVPQGERINISGHHDLDLTRPTEIHGLSIYDKPDTPGGPWKLIGSVWVQARDTGFFSEQDITRPFARL